MDNPYRNSSLFFTFFGFSAKKVLLFQKKSVGIRLFLPIDILSRLYIIKANSFYDRWGAERLRIVPFEPDIGNAFVGKRDAGHLAAFWTAGSALEFACCASL